MSKLSDQVLRLVPNIQVLHIDFKEFLCSAFFVFSLSLSVFVSEVQNFRNIEVHEVLGKASRCLFECVTEILL